MYPGIVLPDVVHNEVDIRVIALDDAGTGGLPGGGNRRLVADELATVSDPVIGVPAAFVLYLGDNFYEDGVRSIDDDLWNAAYRDIYDFSRLPPFYAVLGNHDYRGDPLAQVGYTSADSTWTMPERTYSFAWLFTDGTRIVFVAIDTNQLIGRGRMFNSHWRWVEQRLSEISGGRIIVFGHHPVFSAGSHGNTPESAELLRPILETHGVDLYLAGHDHNL